MREYFRCRARARVRSSVVLPSPGTPSSSTCPGSQQTDQHTFHNVILSDNDFGDFAAHIGEPVHREFEGRFGCHLVIVVQTKRFCSAVEGEEKSKGAGLHFVVDAGPFADPANQEIHYIRHLAEGTASLLGRGRFREPKPELHHLVVENQKAVFQPFEL